MQVITVMLNMSPEISIQLVGYFSVLNAVVANFCLL